MRNPVAICLGLLLFAVPLIASEPIRLGQSEVDRLANQARERWQAPGLAIAVVQLPGEPILRGYGVRQLGQPEPITPDTLFPLASCTKSFTSALIAQLVDEGRLRWDDPVRKHYPEFKLSDPNVTALLTVRDLLSHRTGLAGHDLLWYRSPWKLEEILKRAGELPLEGQFRHTYHYSSIPVMAAGRIAEKLTGKPWEQLIRDRLAKPLGLKPLTFSSTESQQIANRATGYLRNAKDELEPMPEYRISEPNPAGSLSTSAASLAKWLSFQLRAGKTPSGDQLVSRVNLLQTRTPHVFMPKDELIAPLYPESLQVSYCMGWVQFDYHGLLVYAHGGIIDGFRCQLTFLPERQVAIALLNNLHESKLNIALTYSLLDAILGMKPGRDWNEHFWKQENDERAAKRELIARRDRLRRPGTSPSVPLERFAGEYTHPAYGTATVKIVDSKLVWSWSGFRSELEHYQYDLFRITSGYFKDQLIEFGGQNGQPLLLGVFGQLFRRG